MKHQNIRQGLFCLNKIKRIIVPLVILLLFGGAIVFLIVQLVQPKYTYFKPTSEFYINDHAEQLSQGAKWSIYLNSEMLYEDSLDKEYPAEIRGSQVVVATYQTDRADFSSTTLFNEFKIGKNDMGVLIVLLYDSEGNFKEIVYEVGVRMMGYLTFSDMGEIVSHSLETYTDIELSIGEIYFETLERIYDRVYDTNFTYDLALYEEDLYTFFKPLPSEDFFNAGWYTWLIFGDLPNWLSITLLVFFGLGASGTIGFMGVAANNGGGGKSIGYFLSKKK